ncbi:ATP-binding protein [Oleiharenicola lentus]|uniref:sensor histidine kinase n=1 Tax=Oleiharenicola lentus TaxID=2508720 RepID=UPI003F669EFB
MVKISSALFHRRTYRVGLMVAGWMALGLSGWTQTLPGEPKLTQQPVVAAKKSKRVLSHLPDVPHGNDAPADYSKAIKASAARYAEFYTTSKLVDAIAEARNGLAIAEAAHRPRDEAEFLKAALYASWLMGESTAGFDYGQRLLAAADKFDDDRLRSIGHRVIGTIFYQLKNIQKQREHTELALKFAERANDQPLRVAAMNNLGNMYMAEGNLKRAREIHEEVLGYREANGYLWDAAGSLTNLGDVAERAGSLEEALKFQERGLAIRVDLDDRRGQVRSLAQVAGVLRKLGRTDEALVRIVDASSRAKSIGGNDLLNLVYTELALVHEAKKSYGEALAAERLAARGRDQFAGEQARIRASEFEKRMELEQKEKAIERLDRERALQAAELKVKEAEILRQKAEIHASASETSIARWQRGGLLALLLVGGAGVAAIVSRQRLKIAAERRIHAETVAAKEAAEQANVLKSRLIGIVSHDIRSPLSSVISLTDEMREEQPADRHDERLDLIAHQTELVVAFAQDLLDATALESGGIKLNRTTVDMSEIVRASTGHFAVRAKAKRQILNFSPASGGSAQLNGDATKLQQIATNLISNALKYSPVGATVDVSVRRVDDHVLLMVLDQGPGITPDEIARLFQPFAQLRAKPTGGESSTGLGLSIAHELVRLHGGTIRVEPSPSGRGSLFVVELPADSVA